MQTCLKPSDSDYPQNCNKFCSQWAVELELRQILFGKRQICGHIEKVTYRIDGKQIAEFSSRMICAKCAKRDSHTS